MIPKGEHLLEPTSDPSERDLLRAAGAAGTAALACGTPKFPAGLPYLAGSSEPAPRPWDARTSGPPAGPPPVRRPVLASAVEGELPRPASSPSSQRCCRYSRAVRRQRESRRTAGDSSDARAESGRGRTSPVRGTIVDRAGRYKK